MRFDWLRHRYLCSRDQSFYTELGVACALNGVCVDVGRNRDSFRSWWWRRGSTCTWRSRRRCVSSVAEA